MATDTEKLLVLKAYYMGHAVAQKKHNESEALKMADSAIAKLEQFSDSQSKVRLLFYVLLKSEILRETQDVIELRRRAKAIAEDIGGNVFDYFMAVEDATQTRKKVYGIQTGIIADKGVQSTVRYTVSDGFNVWVVSYDAACRALGIDENRLSDKDRHFLYKVSLKEMLEKHGVEYAP